MLAALFNELPNPYLFVGFSLFCGTCIFLWVSQLPKLATSQNLTWKMEMQWVDFGLLMCTCFLAVVLAQVTLGLTLDIFKPDDLEKTLFGTFFFQGSILATIMVLRWKFPKIYRKSLDRPERTHISKLCLAILGYFVKFLPLLWLASFALLYVFQLLDITPQKQILVNQMLEAVQDRPLVFAGLAFSAIVLAPVTEEILFRGYMYRFLRDRYTVAKSSLVSSAVFALIHQSVHAFVPLLLLSLILTFVYERSGKILAPILFHAFYNAHTVGLILLQPIIPKTNF